MIEGLAAMDVAGRVPRLLGALRDADVSALLVTNLTNIRYLTGFTGSAALLVVTAEGELTFVTDGRYGAQAETQLAAAEVRATVEVSGTGQREVVVAAVAAAGATRLGLEADAVTWSAQRAYQETWFPDVELVPTTGLVADLRRTKDPGEVARIEAACAIADEALAAVAPRLTDSPSEIEFGLELDVTMRRLGAVDVSFETIVAAGPNGALPHHRPAERTIGPRQKRQQFGNHVGHARCARSSQAVVVLATNAKESMNSH